MESKNGWMMAYAFTYIAKLRSDQFIGFSKKWIERLPQSSNELG